MSFRNLTAAGDWTWGNGPGNYVTDNAEIILDIATWLREWVGGCFFALKDGIDYTNLLDVGQQANMQSAIRAGILSRNGVIGINPPGLTVLYTPATRTITITGSIQTIYSSAFQLELTQTAGGSLVN